LITALVAQVTALLLVYYLDPKDYGYYSLMIVISQVLFIFVGGWNNALILNFGTKEYTEKGNINNVLFSRFIMLSFSLVLVLCLYILFSEYLKSFIGSERFFDLVLICFFSELLFNFFSNVFYAKNNNMLQSVLNALPKFSIFIYLLCFFSDIQDFVYFIFYINLAFFLCSGSFYIFHEIKHKVTIKSADFKFYLQFSYFQVFSLAAAYIINWGDNFTLSYFSMPIEDIGIYNLAYKVFLSFNVFFALLNIMIPKIIYQYKKSGDYKLIQKIILYRKWFVIVLSVGYIVAIYLLKYMLIYFNKIEYSGSAFYLILLFPAFVLMLYTDFIVPIIINSEHYKKVQLTVFIQAFVNVIFNLLFVSYYGVVGVIIGTTLAYLFKMLMLEKVFKVKVIKYLECYVK